MANLILLQAGGRDPEMALRSALGASHGRLARQLLTEDSLLFFLGGLGGVLIARLSLSALFLLEPPNLPGLGEAQLDLTTFALAFSVMLLAGLAFGGLPIARRSRQFAGCLREGASTTTGARRRTRSTLVAVVGGETVPAWAEFVGVVKHVRHLSLHSEGPGQIYLHHLQSPRRSMTLTVGSELAAETLLPQVKELLRTIDAQRPIFNVRPVAELESAATAETRFLLNLLGAFALLAALLAGVGIYGALAHLVLQSTKEIGVRRACGALGRQIVGRIVVRRLFLTGTRMSIGLLLAWGASRLLETLGFGISVRDPVIFAGVTIAVAVLALMACLVPTIRASRIDPIAALRAE